jgi:hypothetical protein
MAGARPGVARAPAPALALAPLVEPGDLLDSLRAVAARSPDEARERAPQLLADYAVESWRGALADTGAGPDTVQEAFSAAAREIWLWVRGNRVWEQLSVMLAGRVSRRISEPAG